MLNAGSDPYEAKSHCLPLLDERKTPPLPAQYRVVEREVTVYVRPPSGPALLTHWASAAGARRRRSARTRDTGTSLIMCHSPIGGGDAARKSIYPPVSVRATRTACSRGKRRALWAMWFMD